MFYASYEDQSKAEAIAKRKGWKEDEEGFLDTIEGYNYDTRAEFPTKEAAIAWIQAAINSDKSVFGCGEIIECEPAHLSRRCDYCTCRGVKPIRRYTIGDKGIEREEGYSMCCDADDE